MANGSVHPSTTLKAMEREFKSKTGESAAIFEKLLKLLAEKEAECENLTYDLQDQADSRRLWRKRATDAEARIASVQHILVLVDGNQTFFKSNLIRTGKGGVKEAIGTLVTEAKALARGQHENDLPEQLPVIVHIFMDVGKLADDLWTANLLPEPDELWTFIQDVSKTEPGVTISDCGMGHDAVDTKMKHFYELYLENCHCCHLFLALGRESDYYGILSKYADDKYTRSKTSLIKPAQGLPEEHNLPFHTVEFSSLESVRRQPVSFNDVLPKVGGTKAGASQPNPAPNPTAAKVNGRPLDATQGGLVPKDAIPNVNARPEVAIATTPANGASLVTSPRSASINVQSSQSRQGPPVGQAAPSPRPVPAFAVSHNTPGPAAPKIRPPEQALPSRRAPGAVAQSAPSVAASTAPPLVSETISEEHVHANGNLEKGEDLSAAGVLKLDTSSHSSHQSDKAAEQGWEKADTNSYMPAPISVPWAAEETIPWAAEETIPQPVPQRRGNNNFSRRQPRHGNGGGGGGKQGAFAGSQEAKRAPRQFEGSWDDMLASEAPKTSTQGSLTPPRPATTSISSSNTSKSTDFTNAFTRQVVIKSEPNPQARPVFAPIGLNKLNQRIDLKLPKPTPVDEEAFNLRTTNRHLCNEHHLRGRCSNVQCTFDHEEISDGVYLALRNKVRNMPCSSGSDCRRHDCYYAHHCPNVSRISACGRPKCPFRNKKLHDVLELDIIGMIEPKTEELPIEGLL